MFLEVFYAKSFAQFLCEVEIFDFVFGIDVVDLTHCSFVQDCVEGIGCVSCVEVAAGVVSFAVDEEGFVALEEIDEFGDDFCGRSGKG